jgi:hypothetical protein
MVIGEVSAAQSTWVGTWVLNKEESTVDPGTMQESAKAFLIDVGAFSQTTKLEEIDGQLKITADFVWAPAKTSHEEQYVKLDGTPTAIRGVPDASTTFQRIDDRTFEIVVRIISADTDFEGINRFAISDDGNTLTETKTQVYRANGKDLRSSTSVLVFNKK